MYFTLKLRIKADHLSNDILASYEAIYKSEIENIVIQIGKSGKKFCTIEFNSSVPTTSRWQLYCLALKIYKARKLHKESFYNRSSTWSSSSFHYENSKLFLYFGKEFFHPYVILNLSLLPYEEELLKRNKIIRLDIVHDEKYWFANFTLKGDF